MIWQLTDDKRWSALRQRFSWVEEMHPRYSARIPATPRSTAGSFMGGGVIA